MKHFQILVTIALLVMADCTASLAKTTSTPEAIAIQVVVRSIRIFQQNHNGQTPTNWNQLVNVLDIGQLNQQTLANSPAYPIEENYIFITSKIPVHSYPNGDVILIRTAPVQSEERKAGRYLISMIANEPSYRWMDETEVQQMLADAGITELPKPEIRSGPKEQAPVKIPPSVNSTPGQTSPSDGKQPQMTGQDLPNPSASTKEPPIVSNTIPPTVATTTPGSGTGWIGMIVVLALGLLASIFLLFRTKQK